MIYVGQRPEYRRAPLHDRMKPYIKIQIFTRSLPTQSDMHVMNQSIVNAPKVIISFQNEV